MKALTIQFALVNLEHAEYFFTSKQLLQTCKIVSQFSTKISKNRLQKPIRSFEKLRTFSTFQFLGVAAVIQASVS